MVTTQIHVEPAHNDGHGRVGTASDKEQGRILQRRIVVHRNENAESDDGDADGNDGKRHSVAQLVGYNSNRHGEAECHGPRRYTVQLSLDRAVAISLNDAGREVRISVGRHDQAKVHKATNNDLVVLEDTSDVLESDAAIACRRSLIDAQASRNVFLLVFGQPCGLLGEIGEQEPESEADKHGEAALKDENPSPALVAPHAVHLTNRSGKQPTEGSCESGTVEKERVPALRLVPAVPHANEVKGSWEHACLEDAEEETGGKQTTVVLNEALQQGNQAKAEHVDGKPYRRLELLQKNVGGNLKEAVRDEEDDEGGVVFVVLESKLLGQAKDISIGNVHAVCVRLAVSLACSLR